MNSSFKNKHQAFTLIELLVVIAIIAVLASLLMPGISKARDGVRSSVCISNLKQLGAAMYSFASDHEGKLPPVSVNIQDDAGKNYARELFGGIPQWWSDKELLGQYLANNKGYGAVAEPSPLVCPSDLQKIDSWGNVVPSYGYNMRIYTHPSGYGSVDPVGFRWEQLRSEVTLFDRASKTILLIDSHMSRFNPGSGNYPACFAIPEPSTGDWSFGTPMSNYNHVERHRNNRASNILFFDGHAGSTDDLKSKVDDDAILLNRTELKNVF